MRWSGRGVVRQSWNFRRGHGIHWDHFGGFVHNTDVQQNQPQDHRRLEFPRKSTDWRANNGTIFRINSETRKFVDFPLETGRRQKVQDTMAVYVLCKELDMLVLCKKQRQTKTRQHSIMCERIWGLRMGFRTCGQLDIALVRF